MPLNNTFPKEGTKEILRSLGARHLMTDPFEIEGERVQIDYMVYESPDKTEMIIWRKPVNSEIYQFHHEARIIQTRSVPVKI